MSEHHDDDPQRAPRRALRKARIQHLLATILDGVAWFGAFAMIGFTKPEDAVGIMIAVALAGAPVSALLSRLLARSTTKAARALAPHVDAHPSEARPKGLAALRFVPIVRQLAESFTFAKAGRDVARAVGAEEHELGKRVLKIADVRTWVHVAAWAMFAVRLASDTLIEPSRVAAFFLGCVGVFLTAVTGRMLLRPLERALDRKEMVNALGGTSSAVPFAVSMRDGVVEGSAPRTAIDFERLVEEQSARQTPGARASRADDAHPDDVHGTDESRTDDAFIGDARTGDTRTDTARTDARTGEHADDSKRSMTTEHTESSTSSERADQVEDEHAHALPAGRRERN